MDSGIMHKAKSIIWQITARATTFALALAFFGRHDDALEKATTS